MVCDIMNVACEDRFEVITEDQKEWEALTQLRVENPHQKVSHAELIKREVRVGGVLWRMNSFPRSLQVECVGQRRTRLPSGDAGPGGTSDSRARARSRTFSTFGSFPAPAPPERFDDRAAARPRA